MDIFKAGVQYDDFTGTVATDVADHPGLEALLNERGLASDRDVVAGFRIAASAVREGEVEDVSLVAYVYEADEFTPSPALVRAVEVQISPGLALSFFKRFDLVAVRSRMDLSNTEVDGPHYD